MGMGVRTNHHRRTTDAVGATRGPNQDSDVKRHRLKSGGLSLIDRRTERLVYLWVGPLPSMHTAAAGGGGGMQIRG